MNVRFDFFIQKKTPRKVSLPFSVSYVFATPVMVSILMYFQITSLSGVSKRQSYLYFEEFKFVTIQFAVL